MTVGVAICMHGDIPIALFDMYIALLDKCAMASYLPVRNSIKHKSVICEASSTRAVALEFLSGCFGYVSCRVVQVSWMVVGLNVTGKVFGK